MTNVNYYAVLNNFFAAPDDEPLRFIDRQENFVVRTNQREREGAMRFSVSDVETHENRTFYVALTKDGLLSFELSSTQVVEAPDWEKLAQKLEMHTTADYEYVAACIALFLQVGKDPAYKDHYRLELCGRP